MLSQSWWVSVSAGLSPRLIPVQAALFLLSKGRRDPAIDSALSGWWQAMKHGELDRKDERLGRLVCVQQLLDQSATPSGTSTPASRGSVASRHPAASRCVCLAVQLTVKSDVSLTAPASCQSALPHRFSKAMLPHIEVVVYIMKAIKISSSTCCRSVGCCPPRCGRAKARLACDSSSLSATVISCAPCELAAHASFCSCFALLLLLAGGVGYCLGGISCAFRCKSKCRRRRCARRTVLN